MLKKKSSAENGSDYGIVLKFRFKKKRNSGFSNEEKKYIWWVLESFQSKNGRF